MSTGLVPVGAGACTTLRDQLRAARLGNRLRLEQLRARQLEQVERRQRQRELRESISLDWVSPYADLLNLSRYSGDPLVAGPAAYWHRRQGRNWPIYQTEAELSLLRAPARLLLATNGYAQGLVEGLTSYAIGPGCTYRIGKVSDRDTTTLQAMVDAAQRIVDSLLERNSWKGGAEDSIESECFGRSIEDGEFIVCHYFAEDGWTDYRVQETEQLTMPPGADWREYSFGIRTPVNDAAKHLRYYLQYGDAPEQGEEYDPDEVTHFRRNVRRSMKRGITDFCFDTYDSLYLAGKLRTNLGDTAAQQASIVGVRQHDNAAEEDVQAFNDSDADFTKSDLITGRQENIKLYKRGGWEDIPKGLSYVAGPGATNAGAHVQVLDACLRGAGQKWQAPPWLMSGDLNAMNYASSLTAESPFTKTILRNQGRYCETFRRAIWLGLRHYIRTHGLRVLQEDGTWKVYQWEEVSHRLKLSVTAPSPETRNKTEEAQRASIEIGLGVQSRQAYMQEQSRDPDKIEADNQEWSEKNPGGGGQQLPDDVPPDAGGGGAIAPGAPAVESEHDAEEAELALIEAVADDVLEATAREEGAVWKGQSGRWFTKKNGRVVPTKAPVTAGTQPKGKGASAPTTGSGPKVLKPQEAAKQFPRHVTMRGAYGRPEPALEAASKIPGAHVVKSRDGYQIIRPPASETATTAAARDTAARDIADDKTVSSEPPPPVDPKAKKPWAMDADEFLAAAKRGKLRKATEKAVAGEETAKTPLAWGELNKYHPDDIAHWYVSRFGQDGFDAARRAYLTDAITEGKPVPAAALADYPDLAAKASRKPDSPGFTGRDALGREWVNGELVAKQDEPKGESRSAKKPAGKPTTPAATAKGKPAKADPKQTAEAVKAQLAGDATKLTPKVVKDLNAKLNSLTVPQIKALKAEHDLKGGKSKADHIASLLAKAKELKKQADAKKRAARKQLKTPEPEPTPPPQKKREVGEIDYGHKDASNPVVQTMMKNATAAQAVRAVLEASLESDARIEAARKIEDDSRTAWHAELDKKRKNWPKIAKLMAAHDAAQKSRYAIEDQERVAGRQNALNALATALKTESMGGHVLAELNTHASTGSSEIAPLPAAGTENGDKVRAGVVEGVGFVNRLLSNHKMDLTFAATPNGRAFAARHVVGHPEITSLVALSGEHGAPKTVVHEIGHNIEFHKPGVESLANQFLAYRIEGESPTSLKQKFGSGFEDHEFGHKDDFERAMGGEMSAYYAGKKYPSGETEIISMGLDRMFSHPMEFAKADPEYFHFICHVLSM